ncbi:MAG: CvpA family protein, partial [Dehalococcoidia bacterium]|nr:CvpA family protein [Dehalococcoidia bacterium]
MDWLDIVIIALLFFSVIMGLKQGLISSLLSMAGFVLGLALAARYYSVLAGKLSFIPQETIAKVTAFLLILFAVSLAAGLLAWIAKSAVHAVMLGWLDHLGGAVFGFISGAYFLGGILAVVVRFSVLGLERTINSSALAQVLLSLPFISSLLA